IVGSEVTSDECAKVSAAGAQPAERRERSGAVDITSPAPADVGLPHPIPDTTPGARSRRSGRDPSPCDQPLDRERDVMPLNPSRLYTNDERTACKLRCPECHARLALTWRRARRPGRSD